MALHTPDYLLFLAITAILYWIIPSSPKNTIRRLFLLGVSYLFYSTFDIRLPFLLLIISTVNYCFCRVILHFSMPKICLLVCTIFDLAILGFFKYADFFTLNIQGVLGLQVSGDPPAPLNLLLPVGISFYIFQSISTVVETTRKKALPASGFIDYLLILAFYPKLIAGPLVRPTDLASQFSTKVLVPRRSDLSQALWRILLGLLKKIVISDSLAVLSSTAFTAAAHPQALNFPSPLYMQGFYLYAIQIYADFSGYTDVAIGSAALFGIVLPENFRRPYFSTTISDFWNRWHMSLTHWFREYLFFPLSRTWLHRSKNLNPRWIQMIVNLITMVLIGFWHGAAWTFIVWGIWHGFLISIERLTGFAPKLKGIRIFSAVLTFHLVGVGWILFRAETFSSAAGFLSGMLAFNQMHWTWTYLPPVILGAILMVGLDLIQEWGHRSEQIWPRKIMPIFITTVLILLAGLLVTAVANDQAPKPFIYAQF